jgi:hypothetical protein
MRSTQISNEHATRIPRAGMIVMKLEVVVLPVPDVVKTCKAKSMIPSSGILAATD